MFAFIANSKEKNGEKRDRSEQIQAKDALNGLLIQIE